MNIMKEIEPGDYQLYQRVFMIGDTHFQCNVYFIDALDTTSESCVDRITEGFIKEFFTCKVLTEYKMIIDDVLLNVSILLKHNQKFMPEHCPWDYLLFVSTLGSFTSASVETDVPPSSNQTENSINPPGKLQKVRNIKCAAKEPLPAQIKNTSYTRMDHTNSTVIGCDNSQQINLLVEHAEDKVIDQPVLGLNESISKLESKSVQPFSNGNTPSALPISSETDAVLKNNEAVSLNVENIVSGSETDLTMNDENSVNSKVENSVGAQDCDTVKKTDDSALIGKKLEKPSQARKLTKLSTLLANNNDNHSFDNYFQFLKDTGDWLNNNEILLVDSYSQDASANFISSQQEREFVEHRAAESTEVVSTVIENEANCISSGMRVDETVDKTTAVEGSAVEGSSIKSIGAVTSESVSASYIDNSCSDEKFIQTSKSCESDSDSSLTQGKGKYRKAKNV